MAIGTSLLLIFFITETYSKEGYDYLLQGLNMNIMIDTAKSMTNFLDCIDYHI
jgi:hypothetical protein